MKLDYVSRRKIFNWIMAILGGLCVVAVLVPLASILYQAFKLGGSVLSFSFLVSLPPDPCTVQSCEIGGIGPAIQGTLILIGMAGAISIGVGVTAAMFASEYGGRIGGAISFTADVLTGIPSIMAGVVIYSLFLIYEPAIVFSFYTGALALSIVMIPIVTRTCEEALRTVPRSMREASLALGISKWRSTLQIVFVTALPGVITGALLSVMRGAGEAAPLLFTLFGSYVWFNGLNRPGAALPLLIYNYAIEPYSNWVADAWGAVLVLILIVLITSIASRLMIQRMVRRMSGG
jgi:phosphate transport system permease protein